jgi:hypothetical protein
MTQWFEQPNAAAAFCVALEALRDEEGASVEIFADDPEAERVERQTCVEVTAEWTGWELKRFWGATPLEAVLSAGAEQARRR